MVVDNNPDVAKRTAELSFLLFALGGVVGLFNLTATLPFGAGFEMVAIARNLAAHGSFANPLFVLQTGPSAVAPPVYPLLMAFLMKVLHAPAFVLLAVALGNVCANAVTAALLPRVSWLLFGTVRPGVAAAIFWLMAAQLMPSWDASYTLALLLLFCLYSASTMGKARIFAAASSGLLAGVLFLLNPMSLLVFFPWLAHLLVFRSASLKRAAAYCCVVLGTVALMAFPWTLRNYHQLGAFVVRTGLGLNIYFSNNDCSRTNLIEDLHSGCSALYQANFNLSEAEAVRDMGEVVYDKRRLADAEAWMRAHPRRFVGLTASRIVTFWFPRTVEHPFKASVIWVFTWLSLPGLALMAYRRVRVTIFFLVVLLVYPLVYYVIVADVRYRYPILWLSLLPAGYFLDWLFGLVRTKLQSRSALSSMPPSSPVSA